MRRVLALVIGLAFLAAAVGGEESRPTIIQVVPLTPDNVSFEETRIIEVLLQSYIADLPNVVVYDGGTRGKLGVGESDAMVASPDVEPLAPPDYTISGTLSPDGDARQLTLVIAKNDEVITKNDEAVIPPEPTKRTWTFRTTSEIALKLRTIVDSVAQLATAGPAGETRLPEPISGAALRGSSWRGGEDGLTMVRFLDASRAVAVSSGRNITLAYRVEDNKLMVFQSSPEVRWELSLFDNGSSLQGNCIETGGKKWVEWTKLSR